jgi:alpha-1,2-mannosyltransferase
VTTSDVTTRDSRRLGYPLVAIALVGAVIGVIRLTGPFAYGYDYDVYRVAGSALLHGESLFGPWMGQHMAHPLPFTYPPLAAVVAVPFALVGDVLGYAIWNIVSIVALVLVVRASIRPLSQRFPNRTLTFVLAILVALALTPVQDELGFGQVGIVLMAMCFFDCALEKTPWPRGALIGLATAIKLLPGIFIPYLWLSGRRRAAYVAIATCAASSLLGVIVAPTDSRTFWTSRIFDNSRVGNNAYVSNQSLNGLLRRALGSGAASQLLWLALAAAVVVYGLRQAARASRHGDELLGITLCALVGILVSPVSWIHHLVWLVPAIAVLIDDGTDRRRVTLAVTAAALLTLRLPYFGDNLPTGHHLGVIAAVLRDSYGLICIALLLALASSVDRMGAATEPTVGRRSASDP